MVEHPQDVAGCCQRKHGEIKPCFLWCAKTTFTSLFSIQRIKLWLIDEFSVELQLKQQFYLWFFWDKESITHGDRTEHMVLAHKKEEAPIERLLHNSDCCSVHVDSGVAWSCGEANVCQILFDAWPQTKEFPWELQFQPEAWRFQAVLNIQIKYGDCNYDCLYSVVGSKLLQGRFTKVSTVGTNVDAHGYIISAFLTVSWKAKNFWFPEWVQEDCSRHVDQRPERLDHPL